MRLDDRPRRRARIEMIPLIDCMFLLLVFFIYSMLSMTVHRGIQVHLPASQTGEIERLSHIAISVMRDERIFIDKQAVAPSALLDHLRRRHGENPDQPVFIHADEAVRYRVIIDVLDKIRLAGFRQVSLETRERTDEP
jgi:biopolymer transport protein ExbD